MDTRLFSRFFEMHVQIHPLYFTIQNNSVSWTKFRVYYLSVMGFRRLEAGTCIIGVSSPWSCRERWHIFVRPLFVSHSSVRSFRKIASITSSGMRTVNSNGHYIILVLVCAGARIIFSAIFKNGILFGPPIKLVWNKAHRAALAIIILNWVANFFDIMTRSGITLFLQPLIVVT